MFGKNYDKEIEHFSNELKTCDKNIGLLSNNLDVLNDTINLLQSSLIDIAKVQAQHKQFIQFFVNHATVDADAQEDLSKLIQEIIKIENEVKKSKK